MIPNLVTGVLSPVSKPTVTGGTLYTSGGFNYRKFTANGTLGITGGTLVCDPLDNHWQ